MCLLSETEKLRNIPLFRELDTAQCKLVAISSDRLHYQKGDVVFEEGDPPDAVYFMLSGRIRLSQDLYGWRVDLAELAGSAVLGETGVVCDRPRSSSAIAIAETTVLRTEANVFLELLSTVSPLARELVREAVSARRTPCYHDALP
jgi:CRP/FNR family cyclic AMP-dependent transcriptional regulator